MERAGTLAERRMRIYVNVLIMYLDYELSMHKILTRVLASAWACASLLLFR